MNCQICGTKNRDTARFCQNCGQDLLATVFLNRYMVVRRIKKGGMGAIYLANDLKLGNRLCVIKENLEISSQSWKQFQSETLILAKVRHPNLVQIFDYFELGDKQYLVMEYIPGENLEDVVKQRQIPFTESEVLNWAQTLCDVLNYLHTLTPPIFHLDIKPQNIKLEPGGRLVLVDFGIAREGPGASNTQVVASALSSRYAPPEQYTGKTDARSDIYALGATLYFLLTIQEPLEPFNRIQNEMFPDDLQRVTPKLTSATVTMLTTALALNPSQRYESASRLRQAIDAAIHLVGSNEPNEPIPLPARSINIPLSSTLAEASRNVFLETRAKLLTKVVNEIMLDDKGMIEARTILLRGHKGYGSTTIASQIKRQIPGNIGLVVRVRLPEKAPTDDWVPILYDLIATLKYGSGSLGQRLQKTVHEYHHKFVVAEELPGERQDRSEFELSLPEISDPTGSVRLGGGGIKVERDHSVVVSSSGATDKERLRKLMVALQELITYLVSNRVKIVLILDRVLDADSFKLLRSLTTLRGLFILTLVEKSHYDVWMENPLAKELVFEFGKYSEYVPCLWDLPMTLFQHLTRNVPQASDIPELKYFLRYLQLKGRGAPDLVIRSLWPFYMDSKKLQGLGILRNRVMGKSRESPMITITADDLAIIYRAAEIYEQLQQSDRARAILDFETKETAKVMRFALANHILEESINKVMTKQEVLSYARQSLGIVETRSEIVNDVIEYFESKGKVKL